MRSLAPEIDAGGQAASGAQRTRGRRENTTKQPSGFQLLAHYAALAQQRWPDSPLFLYYRLYGESESESNRLSDDDYDQLGQAAETAKADIDPDLCVGLSAWRSRGYAGR